MSLILLRKPFYAISFLATITLLLFSCQKDLSADTAGNGGAGSGGGSQYDLSTKISSSVSGFVTDENDLPVKNSAIQFGSYTTQTDKYGFFEAKNVQVTKNAAFITASKPGYFKGVKTYIAQAGKTAFFRIKLIPKTNSGNINASAGGTVTLSNGLSVTLPAAAIVNAATNAAYTGTVNVASSWINPESDDLNRLMPGDLRGLDKDDAMKLSKTFGMAAVELTSLSGELLQIAAGKKATLSFTIPSSLSAQAPSSIPLWYFDESIGLWKEQSSAIKTGNKYVGDVSHFSYWDCATSLPTVQFNCTVVDAGGLPLPNAEVWINFSNGDFTGCMGTTDANGYATGAIPANSQLILEVFDYSCPSQALATRSITTTNVELSVGNVSLANSIIASITGSLTNCNGQPVTNGYVIMSKSGGYTRYNANSSGNFTFNALICGNNTVGIIGGDATATQEGMINYFPLVSGNNNMGSIMACGNSTQEFVNYITTGLSFTITPTIPSCRIEQLQDAFYPNAVYIESDYWQGYNVWFRFSGQNISAGSTQELYHILADPFGDALMPTTPIQVHITEYGNVGQFISGNFTGTVYQFLAPNTPYLVTCNFRVRRQF